MIYKEIAMAMHCGTPLVLVSVIASKGSTPRGTGATMAVYGDGHSVGTIGGGAVEYEALKKAVTLICEKGSLSATFHLTPNDVKDLGMVCGGTVTVYFQYLNPHDTRNQEIATYLSTLEGCGQEVWLVRELTSDMVTDIGIYTGDTLRYADHMKLDVLQSLAQPYTALVQGDGCQYYMEVVSQSGMVYVFGGGHIAQELVPVLHRVEFPVTVYEDRAFFANPNRFPDATNVILGDFQHIAEQITVNPQDYIVIMTRGHEADYAVLEQVLATSATFIGCVGSKQKVLSTSKKLLEHGFSKEDVARIHSPIGLKIGGRSPAEIAISIAAQMISHRAGI